MYLTADSRLLLNIARSAAHDAIRLYHVPKVWHADVHSDAMLGVARAVERYDPSRGLSFLSFATHKARLAILDGFRSRNHFKACSANTKRHPKYQPSIDDPTSEARHVATERFEDAAEARVILRGLFARISHRLAWVVYQYDVLDRPLHEIGTALGVTESRASQLHNQALAQLREHASRSVNGDPEPPLSTP